MFKKKDKPKFILRISDPITHQVFYMTSEKGLRLFIKNNNNNYVLPQEKGGH